MSPDEVLASYRDALAEVGEDVIVRRYTGTGPSRTSVTAQARARPTGLQSSDLVGAVVQGMARLVMINDPQAAVPVGMVALATLLPLTTDDKVVRDGREFAIVAADPNTRRIAGVIIALELVIKG